jgi:hypothetical protein
MLQNVGVSWEWKDDANRQPMALGHEELVEVITAWPGLSHSGRGVCETCREEFSSTSEDEDDEDEEDEDDED